MNSTPESDDRVVLGDLAGPTGPPPLRLVTDDDRPPLTVSRVEPLPDRQMSTFRCFALVLTLAAIGAVTLTIIAFDPPPVAAGAVLAAVVVVGSLLICAEALTAAVNRRAVDSMTPTPTATHDSDNSAGSVVGGFEVRPLDLGAE